jgi:hypothetical protein
VVSGVYPGSPNKRKKKVDFNGAARYVVYGPRLREHFPIKGNSLTLGSEQLWPRHPGETSPLERAKKFLKEHPEYVAELHRTPAKHPKETLGGDAEGK